MSKNFLLTGYYFNGYHGSMIHICEIGEYLVAQGWAVGIPAMDITQEIREYVESKGIALYSVHTLPKDIVWQYALCYHFPLLPYLLRSGVNIEKLGIGSLSGIEMLESPSFLARTKGLPIFVHCGSLKNKMVVNHGLNENAIFVVPNLVPEKFREFEKTPPPQILNKIAVVSNHVPNEIREAAAKLKQQDIATDFYGLADKHVPVMSQLLAGYDCVVTIGKTVQYALALGIPVFNYDRFGGRGIFGCRTLTRKNTIIFRAGVHSASFVPICLQQSLAAGLPLPQQNRHRCAPQRATGILYLTMLNGSSLFWAGRHSIKLRNHLQPGCILIIAVL